MLGRGQRRRHQAGLIMGGERKGLFAKQVRRQLVSDRPFHDVRSANVEEPTHSFFNVSEISLIGLVKGSSLLSRTKTASSFAGSVLLAFLLIEWIAPGGSDQLSPAR